MTLQNLKIDLKNDKYRTEQIDDLLNRLPIESANKYIVQNMCCLMTI